MFQHIREKQLRFSYGMTKKKDGELISSISRQNIQITGFYRDFFYFKNLQQEKRTMAMNFRYTV